MKRPKGGKAPRTDERIQSEYFEWILRLVDDEKRFGKTSWRKLFRLLHETEFVYILEMDGNRFDDGVDLRYRFAYERGLPIREAERAMGDRPCSVLEMMAALALRCEEHIAGDPNRGDRTGKRFFEMIESLGLSDMDDKRFDRITVEEILDRFLRREYQPDGRGGLFFIPESDRDLRDVEIWYQMMGYLNDTIYNKEVRR